MEAKEEDVLVHELNEWLLREVESAERLPIDEASKTVDGLELVLCFVGDVLASNQMKLERVEFGAQEG
jgi:hypothetical protein